MQTQDTSEVFNRGLCDFIGASPTPFHAVANIKAALRGVGFKDLRAEGAAAMQPGDGYFLIQNDSSIVAFTVGTELGPAAGLRMIGAHTDSPTLMLKPVPEIRAGGYFQLGVQVYGGALLNPWFDRDLSLAGRVSYRCAGGVRSALIDFSLPIAIIPSLAIHLDRDANQNHTVNAQSDIVPLLALAREQGQDFSGVLLEQVRREHPAQEPLEVLDFELSFYDTQPPQILGLHREFIASARLDNLLSCYAGLRALVASDRKASALLICSDHEEVGSVSASGAQGPLLATALERLAPEPVARTAMIDQSLLISADNAHGVHPNFRNRYDDNHGPLLNAGPVIKINANQRYATNSETASRFRMLASAENVPVQTFVVRSDMACGSTIGPLTAAGVGVRTVDVGVPTLAMHSIRELAGSADAHALFRIMRRFCNSVTV